MNARHTADAVVVGAGPAGAATALLLAGAGHEIALLDRFAFPRRKPCGDCLSPAAARILDRLDVLATVAALRPARLEGWRIIAGDRSFEGRFEPAADGDARVRTAMALSRDRLDCVLVDAARLAGAEVIEGVRVEEILRTTRGRVGGVCGRGPDGERFELRAPLVIGADGLRSVVARRLRLIQRAPKLRKLSLTGHVRGVAGLGRFGEMHVGDGICAGLAPVVDRSWAAAGERLRERSEVDPHAPEQNGRGQVVATCPAVQEGDICANLTLVIDADRFGAAVAQDAEAFFWRTVRSFPHLAGRLVHAEFAGPSSGSGTGPGPGPGGGTRRDPRSRAPAPARRLLASGPFDWPSRRVIADGAALVGDAAGYYDPFTGQGIYRALASAELLADAADAALRSGDVSARSLRPYARAHRRSFRQSRLLQHLVEAVIGRPGVAGVAIRRLAKAPAVSDALIAVTGDLRPPHSLLSPSLLLSLLVRAPVLELP